MITYITGDRPNLPGLHIGDDAIKPIYSELCELGEPKQIDFFLYTRGGSMMSSFRIVKLIREYCKKLTILVPWKCHSGGTEICLGADRVVMTRLAELSPVDPSVANFFNPVDKTAKHIPISVEDLRAYFEFANTRAKLRVRGQPS